MTGNPDSPRRLIVWTIVAVAVAILLVWVLFLLRDVLLLIYVSALLAIGFSPVVRLIERQRLLPIGTRRFPRWLAILVVYLVILSALTGLGFVIVPPLVTQAREFTTQAPELLDRAQQYLVERGLLSQPLTWQEAIRQAPGKGPDAVGTVIGALWGFLGGIVGVLTIVILTFYFLIESESLFTTFVRLFPRHQRAQVGAVSLEISRKVSAWLGGQLLLGGVIGVTTALGLGVFGVPYVYVLAVIAAVGELIPIVGPVLAAIPGIAVALSLSWKLALGVALFYLIQQQLEANILVPKLMERQLGVNAVTVIVALLIGSALLGVIGAILAVPTAAIAQVLFQELFARERD
ncbi:MAG TPA: AI-2E family transporter [Methylomirabilota bacterium]|jgi:predicted PurR-regulated permease PerM|nr:AI-2E family transporter [Methylomirabilota bacterium]